MLSAMDSEKVSELFSTLYWFSRRSGAASDPFIRRASHLQLLVDAAGSAGTGLFGRR